MPNDGLTFTFSGNIHQSRSRHADFMDVSVQVWRGDVMVTMIKLVDLEDWKSPEHASFDTVEGFATIAARAISRRLEDLHMHALEVGGTHSRRDLAREFPPVESSQDR